MMTSDERRAKSLRTLHRRLQYLDDRIVECQTNPAWRGLSYMIAEAAALRWALRELGVTVAHGYHRPTHTPKPTYRVPLNLALEEVVHGRR